MINLSRKTSILQSTDNLVFLNFLGLLREKYLRRTVGRDYTFKSVVLAGVHDIKNLKMKIRPDQKHHYNSPWNIAAEFNVDLSFSQPDIERMLKEYESLYSMLHNILFKGETYPYHEYDRAVSIGKMFGFIVEKDGQVAVANRIFETQLYNYFITERFRSGNRNFSANVKSAGV